MAENLPVQHNMKGILRFDVDPSDVRGGDYVDALNIQFIGRGLGQTMPISQVLKNRLAFDMGSVVSQRKIVRISFDLNLPYQIGFLSPNGNGILYLPSGAPLTNLSVPSFASYSAYANFIAASLTNLGLSVVVSTGVGFLDIQLFTYGRLDWSLFSVGTNSFTVSIVSEAIPQNYAGILNLIGGTDLLGDAFLFSTPQRNLPVDFNCSVFSGTGGLVGIGFNTNHGLVTNDEIFIKGGASAVNGYWLVTVLSPSSVLLQFSNFAAVGAGTCVVVLNNRGVGEIGVAVQDMATKAWTYTRLLRSIEFGFTTKRQVECQGEIKPIGKAFYFHQIKYNPPRVFYYRGAYIQDGALSSVSSVNQYKYGSIFNLLKNQQDILEGRLEFISQEAGGSVFPGNKQYFLRMVGQEGALFTTEPFAFTGLVNVSVASSSGDPQGIAGGNANESSGKVNILRATGLRNDLYESVELCVIEWAGDAFTASVVRRELLTGPDVVLRHSGLEITTPLANAELNLTYPKIKNIGTERVIDNRLVYFDIDYALDEDLSAWASSMTHKIFKYPTTTTGQVTSFQFGNYLDPRETVRFLGYTWYETHRFGVRVYWRDGGRSRVYWVDDVKFDISPTNVSLPNRRTGNPTNYDLRGVGVNDVTFTPAVEFTLNLDFKVNGTPVRELISKVEFMRVDLNDNPAFREVLFSGMGVIGWLGFWSQGSGTTQFGRNRFLNGTSGFPDRTRFPFPFFSGQGFFDLLLTPPAPPYLNMVNTTGDPFANTNKRDQYSLFIITNDVLFGGNAPIFEPGDRIINYGRPRAFDGVPFNLNVIFNNYGDFIRDFSLEDLGVNPSGGVKGVQPHLHDILGAGLCARNSSVPLSHYDDVLGSIIGTTFHTNAGSTNSNASMSDLLASPSNEFESCFVVSLNNPMVTPLATPANPTGQPNATYGNTDEGVYYVSYFRERFYDPNNPDNSKFGNRNETVYTTTSNFLEVSPNQFGLVGVTVFGGDTFVTRVQHKIWNHLDNQPQGNDYFGGTYAMSFVSQSYVNPLMRVVGDKDVLGPGAFPQKPLGRYDLWLSNRLPDQTFYNRAYSYQKVTQERNYREPRVDEERFPTLIIWSDLSPSGSLLDAYRTFPPLNRKELDRIYGRIVHAEVINSDLFVMQERKWQREFFNTTGLTSVSPDDLIALGNTGVMSRNGVGLSSYGTRHKWSAIKGKLSSGADCIAWIDVENGVVVRYGGDGTRVISSPDSWWQFIKANTDWVFDFDTPADGRGIMGVWNERFKEFRWAIRGHRRPDISNWVARVNYFVGQTVRVPGIGFEEVLLKECILDHESNQSNNPVTGINKDTFWRLVDVSDNRHFNVYSMVYSEIKNGITTKVSPVPYIKIPWRQDFISQKYGIFASKPIFLENEGLTSWYDSGGSSLVADSFIEPVINYNPDQIKEFLALYVDSSLVPDRVEFETELHRSYLLSSDFTFREGVWVSPIKMDTLQAVNGTNDEDTSKLFGRWIKIKIFINAGNSQSLRNIRVRLKYNARYIQT
jgi:hypothetical protein